MSNRESSQKFKTGNVVKLKSGGPPMTIIKAEIYDGIKYFKCQWFVEEKPEVALFTPDALQLVVK